MPFSGDVSTPSFSTRMDNQHPKTELGIQGTFTGYQTDYGGAYLAMHGVSREYQTEEHSPQDNQQITSHQTYCSPSNISASPIFQRSTCPRSTQWVDSSLGPAPQPTTQGQTLAVETVVSNDQQRTQMLILDPGRFQHPQLDDLASGFVQNRTTILNGQPPEVECRSRANLQGQSSRVAGQYQFSCQALEQAPISYQQNQSGQEYCDSSQQSRQQYMAADDASLKKRQATCSRFDWNASLQMGSSKSMQPDSAIVPSAPNMLSQGPSGYQIKEEKCLDSQLAASRSNISKSVNTDGSVLNTTSVYGTTEDQSRPLMGEIQLGVLNACSERKNGGSYFVYMAEEKAKSKSFESLADAIKKENANMKDLSKPGNCDLNSRQIRHLATKVKKQHQLFAMVVLLRSVKIKKTAVCPRNRVYNKYIMVCHQFDINPMCNASFGKLVRMCFPNVTTRRLGIRGTSRYHYCGLELKDESENDYFDSMDFVKGKLRVFQSFNENEHEKISKSTSDEISDLSFDLNVLGRLTNCAPPFELSVDELVQEFAGEKSEDEVKLFREFAQVYVKFCLSTFKHLRFIQMKSLFDEISHFDLNNKVSAKCFAYIDNPTHHKMVTSFVARCDDALYAHSIMLLSKTVFQDVPLAVRKQIFKLDSNLITYVEKMKILPCIKLQKLASIKIFVGLISSLIRVINNASKLSLSMSDPTVRVDMFKEWKSLNKKRVITREPLLSDKLKERMSSFFCNDVTYSFKELQLLNLPSENSKAVRTYVIRNLSSLLFRSLCNFEDTDPKEYLLCASGSITSIMRALFYKAGNNMQSSDIHVSEWWDMNCWATEFLNFIGLLGGYLKKKDRLCKDTNILSLQR